MTRWPSWGKRSFPVATSQILTTSSPPVVAMVLPSGEKANEPILPWCAGIRSNSAAARNIPDVHSGKRRLARASRPIRAPGEDRAVRRKHQALHHSGTSVIVRSTGGGAGPTLGGGRSVSERSLGECSRPVARS